MGDVLLATVLQYIGLQKRMDLIRLIIVIKYQSEG